MSWTARAEVLADTTSIGAEGAMMCGRCRATGLDVHSFAPLIGATLALGVRPLTGRGWAPWPSDRQLVDSLVDLVDLVAARYTAAVGLVNDAVYRRAVLLGRLAAAEDDDPIKRWRREVADCNAALEVLEGVPQRLRAAAARLHAAPERLGATYAAVYRLVAAGRVMPHDGRWITGEELPA